MASFHLAVQVIKRSKRGNAVAAAAYRAGAKLTDERTGLVHDYSHRYGVVHSEIMLPATAAKWLGDREKLWNHAEKLETRHDAQVAREMNLALPVELSAQDRLELVRGFVRSQFTAYGMVADFAIHEPVIEKGDDPRNHHAHIMLTMRGATRSGLWRVKTREWNSRKLVDEWRTNWADHQNRFLAARNREERVDHRSLKQQYWEAVREGDKAAALILDREPEIHIGRAAKALKRKAFKPVSQTRTVTTYGGTSRQRDYPQHDRGSRLDEVFARVNRNLDQMKHKLDRLQHQAARFRQKRRVYDREAFAAERAREREARQAERERQRAAEQTAWQARQARQRRVRGFLGLNPLAGAPARFQWSPHKAQRRILAARVVDDLDQVISLLTGFRSKTLQRRRRLKGPPRQPGRARRSGGRVRARYPSGQPSKLR